MQCRTISNVPDQCGITELAEVDSIALSSSSWHSAQRFPRALKIEGSLLLKLMQLKLLKSKGLVIVFSNRVLGHDYRVSHNELDKVICL